MFPIEEKAEGEKRNTIIENDCNRHNAGGAGVGSGIHVVGNSCLVERNLVTFNQAGIFSAITGNLFVGNRARGNVTPYTLSGSAAGATVTSANVSTFTNPAAKIAY